MTNYTIFVANMKVAFCHDILDGEIAFHFSVCRYYQHCDKCLETLS